MSSQSSTHARETVDQIRRVLETGRPAAASVKPPDRSPSMPTTDRTLERLAFSRLPEYEEMKITKAAGDIAGIANPFYRLHDGRATDTTSIEGKLVVNFASYDYLGLNGDPRVSAAAKAAIDQFGTSVSASRLSSGERQVHRDLEAALARLHGTEDAIAFVSGHATNVSVIGQFLNGEDLIVSDAVIHNSIMEGAKLSGAKRILCPHGDLDAIERALRLNRARHRRALIVVEGLYGMDGDVANLPELIRIKRRYDAWLMVDEAHSTGALGPTGRGIAEEQAIDPADVDIWMGTLSKAMAAAGGYIAGSRPLIELIKYNSPSFVYSVGLSPPVAAAATAAISIMEQEPWRAAALRRNGKAMLDGARARDLDPGLSIGASIVPVIVGNSPHAVILAERVLARGYSVVPAMFPGVAENQARLRLFVTARHTVAQINGVLDAIAAELPRVRSGPTFVQVVGRKNDP